MMMGKLPEGGLREGESEREGFEGFFSEIFKKEVLLKSFSRNGFFKLFFGNFLYYLDFFALFLVFSDFFLSVVLENKNLRKYEGQNYFFVFFGKNLQNRGFLKIWVLISSENQFGFKI